MSKVKRDVLCTVTDGEGEVIFEQSTDALTDGQLVGIAAMLQEPDDDDPDRGEWLRVKPETTTFLGAEGPGEEVPTGETWACEHCNHVNHPGDATCTECGVQRVPGSEQDPVAIREFVADNGSRHIQVDPATGNFLEVWIQGIVGIGSDEVRDKVGTFKSDMVAAFEGGYDGYEDLPPDAEPPSLGDLLVVMLGGTLSGLSDRLRKDGFKRHAELVDGLAEECDEFVRPGVPS